MARPLILGIDIGSSSVRAALFDHSAALMRGSLVKHERRLKIGPEGRAELDARAAVIEIAGVIDEVLSKPLRIRGEITHVASCAFWHSLLGVDALGRPTTAVLTWADNRSRDQVATLRRRFVESDVHNRTGARFHSSFWPAKLLRLKKEDRDAFERTHKWLSLSDYILLKLCDASATSVSMASATGLFDIRKCTWDKPLLRSLKINEAKLPPIAEPEQAFFLTPKFASRWPRLKDALWLPAVGDGAANNAGAGCVSPSRAALMLGTSGAMRVAYRGQPPANIPDGLFCYRIDRQRVVLGGALSDGGGLYAWLKKNLRISHPDDEIAKEMAGRGADAHGLAFLPFFQGERGTGYHENARGAVVGLTSSHDAIDILQAAMESVAFRFAEIFDQLRSASRIREIVVSGGGFDHLPVWTQIIADVLGRDLIAANVHEVSLRGAVLLALESIGKIENLEIVTTELKRSKFHPKCHLAYRQARKRHQIAYKQLMPKQ